MAPFSKLPSCSSNQTMAALERLGAYRSRSARGSHVVYHRSVDGKVRTAVVLLNRREMPKIALRSILDNLDITLEEFENALR